MSGSRTCRSRRRTAAITWIRRSSGSSATRDIERFASLAGVRGLFPSLSDDFLRDIFDARHQSALLVKGHHYEDLADRKEATFRLLEQAIVARRHDRVRVPQEEGLEASTSVAPFKLVNHKGIWYLAGTRWRQAQDLSRSAKIERLRLSRRSFAADPSVEKTLVEEDGIWLGEAKREIVLKISARGGGLLQATQAPRRTRSIDKELEDGGLIVSAKVGHANQVLPIVATGFRTSG